MNTFVHRSLLRFIGKLEFLPCLAKEILEDIIQGKFLIEEKTFLCGETQKIFLLTLFEISLN
jgi:hypothetical protein